MRKFILFIAVVSMTCINISEARAAITFVQTATGVTNGGTSVSATFGATPTQNNLLIAIAGNRDANASGPTTPGGWSVALSQPNNSPGQIIYYKIAGAAEPSTVTVSGYGTSTRLGLHIYEYNGINVSSPLDQTASASGTGTTVSSGTTAVTAQADELLIAGVVVNNTNNPVTTISAWTNSFTQRNNFANGGGPTTRSVYGGAGRIVSATGAYSTSVTATNSEAWRGQIVTFKASTQRRRTFLVE